jgi:large repetitive protein
MNGRRMLMNAVLRPADRPQNCGLSLASDIAITKVVNNSTPQVASNVTFTIAAINNGPLNSTGVTVNDLLPTGLTYVSHTVSAGTYTPGTGVWSIGSLASGASRTMTITATVTSAAIPSRTNTAVVSASEPDSNPNNNTASASVNPLYANLAVVKTVDNAVQTVGQNVVFTILASNLGPSNANGVVMNDLLPVGLNYVSHNASFGMFSPGTGVWNIGSLANGASQTLTITAKVTSAGLPRVTNTATIKGNEFDPALQNNTSVVTVTPQLSDLVVTKTVNNGAQQVGANVIFTILARNNGPTANTGVVVNDPMPAGLIYVSHTASSGTYTPGSGVWSIGNLAAAQQRTLTITATVTGAAMPSVTNTATITGNVFDPNLSNNTSSVAVSPQREADLAIVKTASTTTPLLNANVTFTLVVTNNGPQNATGVVAQDMMPAGLVYVSHSTATGTFSPGTGLWAIGNLANGGTATLTITATVTQAAVPNVTNVGLVSGNETDPNPSNNTEPETITPNVVTDLSVVKTVDNSTPVVGTNVTFTLVATNNGPSAATGVIVTDVLPPGVVYISHSTATGTFIPITGLWTIGNLPSGQSRTLTITVATTLTAGPSVVNTATITGIETDPNPNNNTESETINILSGADLRIVKTVNKTQPKIGETITFTLVATNDGPEAANGVVITDVLPIGFANPTNISNGGTYNSGTRTFTWPPFNMTVGQSITLTFQVTVVPAN